MEARYVIRKRKRFQAGSAFILAVMLTSLLAIVGVMFVMITRVDRIATSGISENKALDSAVKTIITKISQELILDVPGVDGQEYYDYPDANSDAWLASLEPHKSGPDYYWHNISDVMGYLASNSFSTDDVDVKPVGLVTTTYVREYPELRVNSAGKFLDKDGNIATDGVSADADGDGIADSKWIELEDVMTTKGEPIYAAIRVVDNGGMLNVNTAYEFDSSSGVSGRIDGSSQTQIDLVSLVERGSDSNSIGKLDDARFGGEPKILSNYIRDVVWKYTRPDPSLDYTPFDIGDELELRNRFILKQSNTKTRVKYLWVDVFNVGSWTPYDSDFVDWTEKVYHSDVNTYDYRHIGTTYSMDRIISPDGERMVNVNTANAFSLYNAVVKAFGFDPNDPNSYFVSAAEGNSVAAQIAVNLVDFRDGGTEPNSPNDVNATTLFIDGKMYYGFESQPFISEIAAIIPLVNPNILSKYAVELYNPFNIDIDLNGFELLLSDGSGTKIGLIGLSGIIEKGGYYVISNDDSPGGFPAADQKDVLLKLSANYVGIDPIIGPFDTWDHYDITLISDVNGPNVIDYQTTKNVWFTPSVSNKHVQRETSNWNVVYQTMIDTGITPSLGASNEVTLGGKNYNLGLANGRFVTVGDILKVLKIGPTADVNGIGRKLSLAGSEKDVRMDVNEPVYQRLFNYLTVFDPADDGIDNDGDGYWDDDPSEGYPEWKVPGRININTAPWYVLAQLPWVSERKGGFIDSGLAEEIVNERDKQNGFSNIGQLNNVLDSTDKLKSIDYYARDGLDETDFPDLTDLIKGDGAVDDFEERDLIFSRISNLVTVRSDVFTAYILVRVGTDGGQKRVIAILDRSDVYPDGFGGVIGDVEIRAFHSVPDPR